MANFRRVSSSVVVPAKPAPYKFFHLTALDLNTWGIPLQRRHLFYPAQELASSGFGGVHLVVERLTSSLAKALVHYFPYAGRFALCSDLAFSAGQRPTVECNDRGVEVVVVEVDASLAELGPYFDSEDEVFRTKLLDGVAPGKWAGTPVEDIPLLYVQVTRFACGGICLGVAYNHAVSDGTAFWDFMKSWAEIAQGRTPSVLPHHDRSLFDIASLGLHPESLSLNQNAVWDVYKRKNSQAAQIPEKQAPAHKPSVHRVFHFKADWVTRLKHETNKDAFGSNQPYTAFETLSAFLWKEMITVRELPSWETAEFKIHVNVRSPRLPSVPSNYFGNAAVVTKTSATVGQLLSSPVSFGAGRIHQAIASCTQDYINCVIHESEHHANEFSNAQAPNQVSIGSSPRFPCYDCNFGWGKPAGVNFQMGVWLGGILLFPGPSGPGSILAGLRLYAEEMEALEQRLSRALVDT